MPLMSQQGNGHLFVAASTPAGILDGDVWIDTSTTPHQVKINNSGTYYQPGDPIGSIQHLPALAAQLPAGWLLCDGSAVSRSTYALLFAVVGTLWGVGNGSTTFNLPDLRNYYIRPATNDGDIATSVGEDTHVLTTPELPSHTHGGVPAFAGAGAAGGGNSLVVGTTTTTATGSGTAHENRPASKHCYAMIKAF